MFPRGVGVIRRLWEFGYAATMSLAVEKRSPADLYITSELDRRPASGADYLQEKRALQDLAAAMVDRPEDVLPRFVDLAMRMTGGVSAGLSLYEEQPAPGVFRWRYLRGTLEPFEDALTPRDFSPCGVTLDLNSPVLSRHPERYYNWISDAGIVVPEVLLVPLYLGGVEPLGTLWIVAAAEGHFDRGHARVAAELASFVGIALKMAQTEKRLQAALADQELLADEMSHRVKNLFMVAQGLVRATARDAQSKEDMAASLNGRFQALAMAHGLVRRGFRPDAMNIRTADFGELLQTIFKPHEGRRGDGRPRFTMAGPPIACGETASSGLALVFHELTTNAAKYGSLQNASGGVEVCWTETDGRYEFVWTEHGGPAIETAPAADGFGSRLMRETVVRQFGGTLDHDWSADGLRVRIGIPVKSLAH